MARTDTKTRSASMKGTDRRIALLVDIREQGLSSLTLDYEEMRIFCLDSRFDSIHWPLKRMPGRQGVAELKQERKQKQLCRYSQDGVSGVTGASGKRRK